MSRPKVRDLFLLTAVAATLTSCSGSGGHSPAASPGSGSIPQQSESSQPPGDASGNVTTTGRVAGRLVSVGGPAPSAQGPLSGGTVTFAGGTLVAAKVDSHGRFSAQLRPGTYRVTATSPNYLGGHGLCVTPGPLRVTAKGSTSVKVYCEER